MVEVKYLSMFFNKNKFTPKTKLGNFTRISRNKIPKIKKSKLLQKNSNKFQKNQMPKTQKKNLSKTKSKVNKFSIESESIILDRLQLICTTYCWVEVTEYWRIWPMPIQIIMRRVCRFTHILIIVYMHVCAYRRSSNASL